MTIHTLTDHLAAPHLTPWDVALGLLLAVTIGILFYCYGRIDEIRSRHREFLRRHPELSGHHDLPITIRRRRRLRTHSRASTARRYRG